MTAPVRIQLRRAKGFNLQAASLALNGLPAAKVTRPGGWGNPFIVSPWVAPGTRCGAGYFTARSQEEAVEIYREMTGLPQWSERRAVAVAELRGKNLACWCKPGEPCHADVLLELANK